MKINQDFINKIFTLKHKTNKKEKELLSKYQEVIPLYDIYSHLIYPIPFNQIEDYILNKHYRFITEPQKQIFINYLNKLKNIKKKDFTNDHKLFQEKMEYNLKLIDNYDLKVLEETSIQAFYYGSNNLGQSISICRRKSFHPSLEHLTPYYSLNELIKMGQNMNMIKKEISPIDLQNEGLHYKICKEISKNDIYANEILEHEKYLSKYMNLIKFFSIYGSYFVNKNLRYYQEFKTFKKCPYPIYLDYTKKLNDIFTNSPGLSDEYYLYRFIQNDNFLKNIKIGDIFTEAGIMSTTRNPFYSPDELEQFGMILFKITVPKNISKLLLIESLSVFPHEQEIIFPPFTKLKLISKDKDFNYFHTNVKIEKRIKKRYHFEIVGYEVFPDIPNVNLENIPTLSITNKLFTPSFNERKKEFLATLTNNGILNIKFNNKTIRFLAQTFDSTEAYQRVYSQKDNNGLLLYCFDDYSMKYSIEISDDLVFNYQERFFPNSLDLNDKEIYELIGIIGKLFGFTKAKVFLRYKIENNLIYPEIFDSLKSFESFELKSGFSERSFISKLNITFDYDKHPKFVEKFNSWKEYFIYSKKNNSLRNFYNKWNEEFNEDILESLYSLIDLTDFYNNNNLEIDKLILNKNVSEINRFRQRNYN